MSKVTELPLDDPSLGNIDQYKSNSLWRLTLRRLLKQRSAVIGLALLFFLIISAIFAPVIAPYDPLNDLIGEEDVSRRDPPCVYALGCSEEIRDRAIQGFMFTISEQVTDNFALCRKLALFEAGCQFRLTDTRIISKRRWLGR